MFDSVRIRLTLWYTGVLALILIAFAIAAYLLVANVMRRQVDEDLAEVANAFTGTIIAEQNDEDAGISKEMAIAEATREFRFKDYRFIVFDESRRVVAASEPVGDVHKMIPLIFSAPKIKEPIEQSSPVDIYKTLRQERTEFRVLITKTALADKTYTIVVMRSLRDQTRMLKSLRRALLIAVPLALLLTSLGGYFLARKSLAPVVLMSEQAARISAVNLHERLPVINPHDELGHLAAIFNALLTRLEQSFEQQRRFMADASHELRTPVAVVRGEAEIALSKPERAPHEYRESLAVVGDEGKRLTRIVEDLFMLARADAGQYPLVKTDFYLDELVEECARAARALAMPRGLTLECEAAAESLMRGDETLLRRMLMNLLDNAIKYTPTGGKVSLLLQRQQNNYLITIEDTGTGIPFEAQPHIFERFYRADQARARANENDGAGLGLSIAEWVAEAHGGKIILERSDAHGSAFVVSLPISNS